MSKRILLALLIFISVQADTITIVADEWCPYNCDPKSAHPGYMIEIAQKIFEKEGHTILYTGGISWERAISQTRKGVYDALVGTVKLEAPDFIFPLQEQGVSTSVFVTKASNPWVYTGLDSLQDVTIGYIKGYSYSEELDGYIKKYSNDPKKAQALSGDHAILYNAQKLIYEKIDAYIEDLFVLEHYFHLKGENVPFKISGKIQDDPIYISFSPNNKKSNEYADILSRGMKKLRQSGELAIILQRYGLKDWK